MGATNSTVNYSLPVFVPTDKPAWLVDWNGAMNAIDTAIKQAETKADSATTDIGSIEADIVTINSSLTTINSAVSQLRLDTNANTGSINTINELLGNGTPTTTDKTIIGAINELHSDIEDIDVKVYDFDLTAYAGDFTISSTFTINNISEVSYLLNADKSIGKIYGGVRVDSLTLASGWTTVATFASGVMNTIETAYNIVTGFSDVVTIANATGTSKTRLHFNTDGSVNVDLYSNASVSLNNAYISLPACIYFLKDMGD